MTTKGGDQGLLAMKKIGALFLLAAGMGAVALGFNGGYSGLIVLGFLMVAGAVLLLVLKAFRRDSLS
jgi:hypothetical protein